eukprot:scaffold1254_cov251-Pinguiococcus_pyrenoidosus.AAC.10
MRIRCFPQVYPDDLGTTLKEAGMLDTLVEVVTTIWEELGGAFVKRLKAASFGAPLSLTDSTWYMHLTMGRSGLTRLQEPTAIFELTLERPSQVSSEQETIGMEFDHDELSAFFGKLEQIQEQLDALG